LKGREGTYAEVAVNISTFLACVTRLKHKAKQAVNATKIARRASMLETKYRTMIEDIGIKQARTMLMTETMERRRVSEY
jgi:hypothetical protein